MGPNERDNFLLLGYNFADHRIEDTILKTIGNHLIMEFSENERNPDANIIMNRSAKYCFSKPNCIPAQI
jgi:hypothetical protein